MKKLKYFQSFFLLMLTFVFSGLYTQETNEFQKGKFNIGAEGGVQFNNIDSPGHTYPWGNYITNTRTGYTAGFFGEYYITNSIKFKVGAIYDKRGFQLYSYLPIYDTATTLGQSYYLYQVDYNLDYLTIPIGFVYEKGSDKFKVFVQVNFYYSFLLNATQDGFEDFYVAPDETIDLGGNIVLNPGHNVTRYEGDANGISVFQNNESAAFNVSDFGINLSIGLLYKPSPSLGICISPGFGYSFGHLFEDPNLSAKWTQLTRISIGFIYTIKKKKQFGE